MTSVVGCASGCERLRAFAERLSHAALPLDQWSLLHMKLSLLERTICGGPRLIDPELGRRREESRDDGASDLVKSAAARATESSSPVWHSPQGGAYGSSGHIPLTMSGDRVMLLPTRGDRRLMKILALSTSTGRGSIALVCDGDTVAATSYVDLQSHAERLFGAIDAVLAEASATRAMLGGLACDIGPGSFTGVRVGVASLKGIALGLGLPLAGVVSLEAMAAAAFHAGVASARDLVIAAVDAKKGELFVAAYDVAGVAIVEPCIRPRSAEGLSVTAAPAAGRLVVVGEVAEGLALPEGAALSRGEALDLPHAGWIGRLAAARLTSADADSIEPLYVRPPDAKPASPKAPASG